MLIFGYTIYTLAHDACASIIKFVIKKSIGDPKTSDSLIVRRATPVMFWIIDHPTMSMIVYSVLKTGILFL